jgi:hypothetical protein
MLSYQHWPLARICYESNRSMSLEIRANGSRLGKSWSNSYQPSGEPSYQLSAVRRAELSAISRQEFFVVAV